MNLYVTIDYFIVIVNSQDYAVTIFASQSMNSNLRCIVRGKAVVILELRDVSCIFQRDASCIFQRDVIM